MSGEARYSQPLPALPRDESSPVVHAGFTNDGSPGYIVRERGRREIREESTRENRTREHPGGFGAALGRLWAWAGGKL